MIRFRLSLFVATLIVSGAVVASRGFAADTVSAGETLTVCATCAVPHDGSAFIRLMGGLPTDTWLDMSLDGEPIFKDLEYMDVGDYEETGAGIRVLRITPKDASDPVIEGEIELAPDSDYTVAVAGTEEKVEAILIADDNTAPEPGEARIKLVNLAHGAPPVDVLAGDVALWENVAYGEASAYIRLDAGTYGVEVREAGTETQLLAPDDLVVDADRVYTLFVLGRVDGEPPLMLLQSTDAAAVTADQYALALPALFAR